MELAGKNDSIVCSAFYPKFGPWYFDKALGLVFTVSPKEETQIIHYFTVIFTDMGIIGDVH